MSFTSRSKSISNRQGQEPTLLVDSMSAKDHQRSFLETKQKYSNSGMSMDDEEESKSGLLLDSPKGSESSGGFELDDEFQDAEESSGQHMSESEQFSAI